MKTLFERLKHNIKHNQNSSFVIFIIFFISGYSIFFTSLSWFPSIGPSKNYTPLESKQTLDNREYTLKNWVYSPDENLMEIEIDVKNNNFDGIDKYLYSCRDEKYNAIEVMPIIEDQNLLVYHIKVPSQFKELSFRLKVDNGQGNKFGDMIRFYTNYNVVETVAHITPLSINGYYAQRLERSINIYNKELSSYQNKINELKNKIQSAKEEINTLKDTMALLSSDEAEQARKRIHTIQKNITDFNQEITITEETVFDITDKIQEADKKLEEYQNKEKNNKKEKGG